MSIASVFEKLHPDIIQSFIQTGKSEAIPPNVQHFISILDKIPDLHRKFPNISRCARELKKLYPQYDLSFQMAREFIYTAINYFHLNNSVKNEAWNQLYADRAEDLHHICVKMGDMKTAKEYLYLAHEWRQSKKENSIDVSKLVPVKQVLSPKVTPALLGLKEYNLKTLWSESFKIYKTAAQEIDSYEIISEDKERLKDEARLNMNIDEEDAKL